MPTDRTDIGYLLAVASRRWNEILERHFAEAGYAEVRASYGALLIPLFEKEGMRMGELAGWARLSKQTVTTMVRLLERDGLLSRRPDPDDARATRLFLTPRARSFKPVAESVLGELDDRVAKALGKERAAQLKSALGALADLQ
jgi:DNA-binding MarR family transcriptional regulator